MTIKAQIFANYRDAKMTVLSFLPRIRVRDKLRQESRVLEVPRFRIKCGMTARRPEDGEMEVKIYINLKKQSQSPAFGWKSEALNPKSERDEGVPDEKA